MLRLHALEAVHELREFNMEPLADAGKYLPHRLNMGTIEDPPPILRREDQMGVKQKDAVSS